MPQNRYFPGAPVSGLFDIQGYTGFNADIKRDRVLCGVGEINDMADSPVTLVPHATTLQARLCSNRWPAPNQHHCCFPRGRGCCLHPPTYAPNVLI